MKYMGSLYAVDDKERTIAFYKEVCGLRVIQDFGTNFTMTGGISFQRKLEWFSGEAALGYSLRRQ